MTKRVAYAFETEVKTRKIWNDKTGMVIQADHEL